MLSSEFDHIWERIIFSKNVTHFLLKKPYESFYFKKNNKNHTNPFSKIHSLHPQNTFRPRAIVTVIGGIDDHRGFLNLLLHRPNLTLRLWTESAHKSGNSKIKKQNLIYTKNSVSFQGKKRKFFLLSIMKTIFLWA